MSLFPNESYSFPDLSEGAKKLRKLKEPPAPPAEIESVPETSPQAAPAETPTINETVEWAADAAPASEVISVEPPKPPPPVVLPKPIKPIPRGRLTAPPRPTAPARAATLSKPARPIQRVLPVMPVAPAVPDQLAETVPEYVDAEPDPIEMSEENVPQYEFPAADAEIHSLRKHRRNKLIRFIVFEALAIGVFLVSTKLAIADQFAETSLTVLYKTLMFVAALAAAIIPVLFYALPPTLPPGRQ